MQLDNVSFYKVGLELLLAGNLLDSFKNYKNGEDKLAACLST